MEPKAFLQIIWSIGKNTYKEVIRDRLLYGIMLVALLVLASSFFMSTISLGQDSRVLQNIGLASIHLFTLFICIFVVTTSMNKDIERRALYFLFPKPLSRAQYILGKFLGFAMVVATTLGILGGVFIVVTFFTHREIIPSALINLGYSFLELTLVSGLALLFSAFTAPLNAALYGIAFFIIGHSLPTLKEYVTRMGSPMVELVINVVYYLLPNLEKFDVRTATLYGVGIPAAQVAWSLFYWALYLGVILFLAITVIRKREL